jgi:hypothetical protein
VPVCISIPRTEVYLVLYKSFLFSQRKEQNMNNQNSSSNSRKKYTELSLNLEAHGNLHRVAEVKAKEITYEKNTFYAVPEIQMLSFPGDREKITQDTPLLFHVQQDGKKKTLAITEGQYSVAKNNLITLNNMVLVVVKEEWIN